MESFNGKLRDELLNGEIFYTPKEAQILMADWRRLYNGLRPHGSLRGRPSTPETLVWPRSWALVATRPAERARPPSATATSQKSWCTSSPIDMPIDYLPRIALRDGRRRARTTRTDPRS
jgi:hypothetical protein